MSDDDRPFEGWEARWDLDESFPPSLQPNIRGAIFSAMPSITASFVALELLRLVAARGGTRVTPSAIEGALEVLAHAVTDDVPPHCRDEARRIASWLSDPPAEARTEPQPDADLRVMHESDVRSRVALVRWAVAEELDLELEWFDPDEGRWPRRRATPVGVVDDDEEDPLLVIETLAGESKIPVSHIRWLMPVERRDDAVRSRVATVLTFPTFDRDEEE